MTCRSEHPTHESRAPALRLHYRLSLISADWVRYQAREDLRRAREKRKAERRRRAANKKVNRKRMAARHTPHSLTIDLNTTQRKRSGSALPVASKGRKKLSDRCEKDIQNTEGPDLLRSTSPTSIHYIEKTAVERRDRGYQEENGPSILPSKGVTGRSVRRARRLTRTATNRSPLTNDVLIRKLPEGTTLQRPTATSSPTREFVVTESSPDSPQNLQAETDRLEREYEQSKKELDLVLSSRRDRTSVTFEQWQDVMKEQNVAQVDRRIAGYMDLARRRSAGEECDGWAYGMYFGP